MTAEAEKLMAVAPDPQPQSLEELERLVGFLPEWALAQLALGPIDSSATSDCRVCDVTLDERLASSGPAGALHDFHQLPEPDHEEAYARCCLIYYCAGWPG